MEILVKLSKSDKSTLEKAKSTAELIIEYVNSSEDQSMNELCKFIENLAKKVALANPMAFAVVNTMKSILTIIKRLEEKDNEEGSDLRNLANNDDDDQDEEIAGKEDLQHALNGFMEFFEGISANICVSLLPHIENHDEVILTFGYSPTLVDCFKAGTEAQKKFKVLVVQTLRQNKGPCKMVTLLREARIEAYEVNSSAVFSVMAKVTKVIVNCFALMADGGIINKAGILSLGMVAKEYSIPFLVVSPFYKLTPKFCFGQDTYNTFANPAKIFNPNNHLESGQVDVIIPEYEFLAPEYITLHINQFGEQTNFYIYRLFNWLYTKEESNAKY